MKRSPLKRGGPIERKTRLKPKRAKPRRNEVIDEDFLAFVRTLPCRCDGRDPDCKGRSEAHHTIHGDDHSAIPLSWWCHHKGRHGDVGGRRGWVGAIPAGELKRWEAEQVTHVRSLWQAQRAA